MKFYLTPIGISVPQIMSFLPPTIRHAIPLNVWYYIGRITWPQVIAVVSFPICFGKQVISCVQFWKAAKHLTEADREERWEKKFGRGKTS